MRSKPSHSVFFNAFPFAISELSTLYSQTTILSNASYYFQEIRATLEKFFPTLEKLFSTLEKSFSRHEKKFSSPALIFENKLSLFNVAHAFHISPNFSAFASKRRDSPLHSLPHLLGISDLSILKKRCKQHARRLAAHLLILNAAGNMDDKMCPPFHYDCCYCALLFSFSKPPPHFKKQSSSLHTPTDNVAHAHGQRCPRP